MPRIVLKEQDSEKVLMVAETDAVIGRDPACGLPIDGPNAKVVSGRHARIFFEAGAWWIQDTSRNGTILDNERLQLGQRHAITAGQVIGLGESGPRYRVMTLDARVVPETVMEVPDLNPPAASQASASPHVTTAPRRSAPSALRPQDPPPAADARTAALRYSEAMRAGLRVDESTEPMSPSPDWLVHVVLRATSTNQRFDLRQKAIRLGRSPECAVQVAPEQGASVSRHHAEICIEEGGVMLRDLGSRNGTFLNGRRINPTHPIMRGDLVMLGTGGPTFSIEDLHIVKGEATPPPAGGRGSGGGVTPPHSNPVRGPGTSVGAGDAARRSPEPPTAPAKPKNVFSRVMGPATQLARRSFAGVGRTAFFKDILEDMSRKNARRVRIVVWGSVGAVVAIATGLVGATQWRVARAERQMIVQQAAFAARTDSIRVTAGAEAAHLRAEFDSARLASAPRAVVDSLRDALAAATRRTGVLEQALVRARQSLDQQLAAADTVRRRAEEEMVRLRSEVARAQNGAVSRQLLDSLRRALGDAEARASAMAVQVSAVRKSDLAQVAQLNQGAVGLLVSFVGSKVVSGTGFAITPSGYFVTNRHVVTNDSGRVRDTIYVTMADEKFGLSTRVRVVALGAGDVDLAVVKIPQYRGPYVQKVSWATGGAVQGEPAALIGFPYGIELAFDDSASRVVRTSMSAGIFSKVAPDRIQFDGFTVGGSSGSPIFNSSGEVVAVHRAGLSGGPGLGFSVPIARVVPLLPSDARTELGLR